MTASLRVVFMGSPEFALPSCESVYEHFDLVGVMSAPDAVRSRGKVLSETPVAAFARKKHIACYKTDRISDKAYAFLCDLKPDVICVVAFGALLPQALLDLPRFGAINVHASLLPNWRGAAPIERAILAGDPELGVSIMQMGPGLDDGDICLQAKMVRDHKTQAEITRELATLGAEKLIECLYALQRGEISWQAQKTPETPYAKKLSKSEFIITPDNSAEANFLKVQASSNSYPAKFFLQKKGVRVLWAEPLSSAKVCVVPESILRMGPNICLASKDGSLLALRTVKPDGKKEMAADAWARGIFAHTKGPLPWE